MVNKKEGIRETIRKEVVRAVLERVQGARWDDEAMPQINEEEVSGKYEVEEIINIPYMNRSEVPLAMDIFKPIVSETDELPVVVNIHGGGLVMGDRRMSRYYAKALAGRGYLVFSIEYRLAPRANTCEQLDDVCAGMDLIGKKLVDYNVDFTRMFLTADSAGAYLATYVAAMRESKRLQDAIGYKPTRMKFKALGLFSGMFYTNRNDPIGWILRDQFYGEKAMEEDFKQFMDPENPEILYNLPPVALVTSQGDFLNNYSISFNRALKKAGKRTRLFYYAGMELKHTFPTMAPYDEKSVEAIDSMFGWMEEQAKKIREENGMGNVNQEKLDKINERIMSDEIIEQKAWEMIKELNSYSEERLNSVALINGERSYTYRQMFRMWEKYAEVFSAIGISEENNSRVGLISSTDSESIITFYALNMMNVSTVMLSSLEDASSERFKMSIQKMGITDIIIAEKNANEKAVAAIMKNKLEWGIDNVVILDTVVAGPYVTERDIMKANIKYNQIKQFPSIRFMKDLLVEYEAYPIAYGSKKQDNAAVVVHTTGTTSGIHKPIPLSDRGINAAVIRVIKNEDFSSLRFRAKTLLIMDLSGSYGMIDMIHLPLAFGGTVVSTYKDVINKYKLFETISYYKVNVMMSTVTFIAKNMNPSVKCDLSCFELFISGGVCVSEEDCNDAVEFFKNHNSNAKVIVGYGLSEVGAACIISKPGVDEASAMGHALDGVKIKLYDEAEDKYYDPAEGPRTGVLFISSPSVSCGKIGDEVFFELTEIDGDEYINTYDLVKVDEKGCYHYVGRMDKYFVNNDGIRFDSGLVETSLSEQQGIETSGLVPEYNKLIHDTVPVLYVQTKDNVSNDVEVVKSAIRNVFINEDLIKKSNIPNKCMICKDLPLNSAGKLDTYKIRTDGAEGKCYVVVSQKMNDKIVDIKLVYKDENAVEDIMDPTLFQSIPEELKDDFNFGGDRFMTFDPQEMMMNAFIDMMKNMQKGQMPFGSPQWKPGQMPGMPPFGQFFEMFKNMMPQGQPGQMPEMPHGPNGMQGFGPKPGFGGAGQEQAGQNPGFGWPGWLPGQNPGMPPFGQFFEMFKGMMPQGQPGQMPEMPHGPNGMQGFGPKPGFGGAGQEQAGQNKGFGWPGWQAGQNPGMPPFGQFFEMFKNMMPQGQPGQMPEMPHGPNGMQGFGPKSGFGGAGQEQAGQNKGFGWPGWQPGQNPGMPPFGPKPGMPPFGQFFEMFKGMMPQGQAPGAQNTGTEEGKEQTIQENIDQEKNMDPPNMFAFADFLRTFFNASPINYDYQE
ncbi:MAG: AMP-binding protein [Lachnospiraceae bacterium]|nr:AMP-binding protein [Lachnospiraceae bacterium]